jgi:hypothetical protein
VANSPATANATVSSGGWNRKLAQDLIHPSLLTPGTHFGIDGGPGSQFDRCEVGTDCSDCGEERVDVDGPSLIPANVAVFLVYAATVFTFLTVCQVRAAIRKRDAIAPKNCADYEDCCFSFFCLPCTTCQILRHETQGEAYSLVQLV